MSYGAKSLKQWAEEMHAISKSKGFGGGSLSVREQIAVSVANMISEPIELWESYRKGELTKPCNKAEKMVEQGNSPLTCFEEELADIVIRAMVVAEENGIDIEHAVRVKAEYNESRPHRHGGKLS